MRTLRVGGGCQAISAQRESPAVLAPQLLVPIRRDSVRPADRDLGHPKTAPVNTPAAIDTP